MKIYFIVNPGSNGGTSLRRWQLICEYLQEYNVDWKHCFCESLEHVHTLSIQANRDGYDVIVVVGGDGTINRTLNGFFDSAGMRISGARMGVVYTGTSPDFCRSYGIPLDARKALQSVLTGQTKSIGIGRITLAGAGDQDGGKRCLYFACCANVGLGASLARAANSGIRRYVGDRVGTFLSLLQVLALYRPGSYRLVIDGKEILLSDVHNISVGKTYHIASGIKVHNELVEGDRRFYVLAVSNLKRYDVPRTIAALYSGGPIRPGSNLSLFYGNVIEIFPKDGPDEVEFDGDPIGRLPCRIEMARDTLELITGTVDAYRT